MDEVFPFASNLYSAARSMAVSWIYSLEIFLIAMPLLVFTVIK